MRHRKDTVKLGRTGSHVRCMMANMLKSLIEHGRIETTISKAKELRRHADNMITLAKENSICAKRRASAHMMVRYNKLTPKEQRVAKTGNLSSYNNDRKVINKLFNELGKKYVDRKGGYTRIIRKSFQVGDNAPKCYIEFV